MLKLCGVICVLGAAAWMGISFSRRLQRRVHVLQSLMYAFSQLRTEIVFMQSPLPEAVMSIAAQTGDGVFKAFAARLQAGDLPMDAMRVSLAGEDSLTNSDKRLLLRTAQPLGSSDTEAQCRHIENAQAQLSAQLAQAKEAAQTNGKLYMAAGVLGGLLLVILLL